MQENADSFIQIAVKAFLVPCRATMGQQGQHGPSDGQAEKMVGGISGIVEIEFPGLFLLIKPVLYFRLVA